MILIINFWAQDVFDSTPYAMLSCSIVSIFPPTMNAFESATGETVLWLNDLDIVFLLFMHISPDHLLWFLLDMRKHHLQRKELCLLLTFHFSISSCFALYCFTKSSRTLLKPSELVSRAGITSLTVRSMRTPFIMRKHLRSPGSGIKVSRTSLEVNEPGEFQRYAN